ncbi:MAG: hypothetical protein NXI09_12105 [Bacteroidetes bacterium]|nr:hypothetical protein [Bacteroidota bacterium]
MSKTLRLALLFLVGFSLKAQYQFRQINTLNNLREDALIYEQASFHTSIRPFNRRLVDSISSPNIIRGSGSWWNRKLWYENLVRIETDDYAFTVDPVVNLQLGYEPNQDYRFINTRGYNVSGRIGRNLSFRSIFLENQARFPDYIKHYSSIRRVIPGQSSLTRSFGETALDYTYFEGEISYKPNQFFNFTAGQGRNFIGEGHRSLLLSDASFSYPFFRIETDVWRIKYVNLWAQLYDPRREAQVNKGVLAKKYLSSHYLSINLTDRWNFAIFESIVYGDTNQLQALDVSFLNPVVFYRPVEFAVGSRNGNALLGANSSYKFKKGLVAYGQFVLDEFRIAAILGNEGDWTNKFGWQIGFKDYNAWGIDGLFQRLEYNAVRPYTYSHRVVLTNYAHYGSPLAHPWGANFHEIVFQNIYQRDRWEFDFQFTFGLAGNDRQGENWGSDVYQSYESRVQDLGNDIAQGATGKYYYTHLRAAYVLNPPDGLKLEAGFRYRYFDSNTDQSADISMLQTQSTWFFVGLRTELFNQYFDL